MIDKTRMKRFVIEFGMGIDQHGQNATRAAVKAVKDAVARSCLAGMFEVVRLPDVEAMNVEIQIACPFPEKVDREVILAALPFGYRELEVREGGMLVRGLFQAELGDQTDEAYVANAAVIVWIDPGEMLRAWGAPDQS